MAAKSLILAHARHSDKCLKRKQLIWTSGGIFKDTLEGKKTTTFWIYFYSSLKVIYTFKRKYFAIKKQYSTSSLGPLR